MGAVCSSRSVPRVVTTGYREEGSGSGEGSTSTTITATAGEMADLPAVAHEEPEQRDEKVNSFTQRSKHSLGSDEILLALRLKELDQSLQANAITYDEFLQQRAESLAAYYAKGSGDPSTTRLTTFFLNRWSGSNLLSNQRTPPQETARHILHYAGERPCLPIAVLTFFGVELEEIRHETVQEVLRAMTNRQVGMRSRHATPTPEELHDGLLFLITPEGELIHGSKDILAYSNARLVPESGKGNRHQKETTTGTSRMLV